VFNVLLQMLDEGGLIVIRLPLDRASPSLPTSGAPWRAAETIVKRNDRMEELQAVGGRGRNPVALSLSLFLPRAALTSGHRRID